MVVELKVGHIQTRALGSAGTFLPRSSTTIPTAPQELTSRVALANRGASLIGFRRILPGAGPRRPNNSIGHRAVAVLVAQKIGPESRMDPGPNFFMLLMSGFVLLYDIRLNTTARVHLDAILGRPHPYRLGVRTTLCGLRTSRHGTATRPGYLATGVGKTHQGLAQLICVSLIEINFIFTAIQSERYRFRSFRTVNIIFQQHDCLFCHETRLSAC